MTISERIETWLGAGGVPSTDIERRLIRRLPTGSGGAESAQSCGHRCGTDGTQSSAVRDGDARGSGEAGSGWCVHQRPQTAELERDWSKPMTLICGSRRRDCTRSPVWSERPRLGARSRRRSLPYVFPGEPDPLMVDVLAAGERCPALHVDWIRKLTDWIAPPWLRTVAPGLVVLARPPESRSRSPGTSARSSRGGGDGAREQGRCGDLRGATRGRSAEPKRPMGEPDERIVSLARLAVSQH